MLIAALTDYMMCLEDKVEDLNQFSLCDTPKMTEGEIQAGRLKEDVKGLRAEVISLQETSPFVQSVLHRWRVL